MAACVVSSLRPGTASEEEAASIVEWMASVAVDPTVQEGVATLAAGALQDHLYQALWARVSVEKRWQWNPGLPERGA